MFYKNYLLILTSLIMFSFFEKTDAKYEELFFDLSINDIKNNLVNLSDFKGKTILLVNVASNCGFTKQYNGLQTLYETYKDKNFIVIGIPSNQFGGQEPGTNKEINDFCETNFNITFLITNKVDVKGENAHNIYKWAKKNYGQRTVPKWNFHKILINKHGKIHDTFNSFTKPNSKKITTKIEKIL